MLTGNDMTQKNILEYLKKEVEIQSELFIFLRNFFSRNIAH